MKKKVILGIVLAAIAVAAVCLVIRLIGDRNLAGYEVTEDVPCPYFWKEQRDGSVQLRIDGAAYPEYSWRTECVPMGVVIAVETGTEKKEHIFTMTAVEPGDTAVQIVCEKADPFPDRVFEITLTVQVTEDRQIVVWNTAHQILAGITSSDATLEFPYEWWTDENGMLNLIITDDEEYDWTAAEYAEETVLPIGPFFRDGSCGYAVEGLQAGTSSLVLYNENGTGIRLTLEVDEERTVHLTAHETVTYTSAQEDTAEDSHG